MSLHQIANHLQGAGRNGDSVLVHMTPGEVRGLQALAMAHGGSLTINPETGLPESFFLAAILPTILGAGMQAAGVSALNAALLTGAATTAITGDLGQGIMAGLGAYGGAGLAGGLSKMGTAPAVAPSMNVATPGVEAMKQGFYGAGKPIFSATPTMPNAVPIPASAGSALPGASAAGATPVYDIGANLRIPQPNLTTEATVTNMPSQTIMDKLGAGVKRATSGVEGLKELYGASEEVAPGSGLANLTSTLGSNLFDKKKPKESKSLIRPYKFRRDYEPGGYGDTGYGTSERRYFDEEYEALEPYEAPGPEYAADGGLMGIARYASGGSTPPYMDNTGEYVRYTGSGVPPGNDYYYVSGGIGPGYYMVKRGSSSSSGDYDSLTPYEYDYDRETGKFTRKNAPEAAKLSTDPRSYTAEDLKPLYQQYFGRDVDPEGITAYTGREFSPSQLDTIFKASPEYAARQQQLEAAKKEASYATPTQAANIYRDVFNRPIDPVGLKYYTQENRMSPAELKKALMGSEEYLTKLTKPLAPRPFVTHSGAIGLEGAMRTPEQEAARPRDMSSFYATMNKRLEEQAQKQGNYAVGGPVEQMSAMNAIGGNTMYPQSQFQTPMYSNPMIQRPMPSNVIAHGLDAPVDPYTGEQKLAGGGLGGYSDGGRLLKGPGDGVSDSIPAVIGKRQPARLADGEFVVPARIVSELGNGSTEAGARKLYAMMDRVQKARRKSVGKNKVAVNSRADKHLPA